MKLTDRHRKQAGWDAAGCEVGHRRGGCGVRTIQAHSNLGRFACFEVDEGILVALAKSDIHDRADAPKNLPAVTAQ